MMIFSQLCFVVLYLLIHVTPKPNFLFIVADDLGFTDVGFRSENQIKTPNIDNLYNNGIYLNNYYVLPVCSPTRASIMTGRYPLRMGLQDFVIFTSSPYGLHKNETLLINLLKSEGYTAHGVGKWHLGHNAWIHTPTFRGFDSFYGFYTGAADYYTHIHDESFDFRYDKQPNCGVNCSEILYNTIGEYSTELFTNKSIEIINNHNKSNPLFLYLAYQAVHSPGEVPQKYVDVYNNTIKNQIRRNFAGMVSCMDESIGYVIDALKNNNMFDDTYIIFTSDNGGPISESGSEYVGANNYPYRGGKHSFYEGGIKSIGIINGPNIPHHTYNGLLHSVDWLPTICTMLNISYMNRTLPLDGYNQFNNIINNKISDRTNITINIEMSNPAGPRAAYRSGDWKILIGPCGPPYGTQPIPTLDEMAYPDSYIPHQSNYEPCQEIKDLLKSMNFPTSSRLELYNINDDPYETKNIIESNEGIAIELINATVQEYKVMFPAYNPYYKDPAADEAKVNNTWMPWMDGE